jgi:uncharacterized protein YdhG (YjbR/CyaY superfamily)
MTVDEFVRSKVRPEFRPVVAAIRSLMKRYGPKSNEAISYGIPMYGLSKPIAWINPSKTGVTFGFREGARFEDRYGLLRRIVKYYIKQALTLDKR